MLNGIFNEVESVICSAAPVLASALGGPLSGIATNLLCNAFNVLPKNPSGIVEKILADIPGSTEKLQNLEQSHSDFFSKLLAWKAPSELEINLKMKWDNQN